MLFLMKIPKGTRKDGQTADELAQALFRIASCQYNEDCSDSEAYLWEPTDTYDIAKELSLLDGKKDPEVLKTVAKGWNNSLARSFDAALAAILTAAQSLEGPDRWLAASSTQMYDMKKAAMALDNDFYAFAEYALLVNDKYITTRLQDKELAAILASPEDYAAITVHPK